VAADRVGFTRLSHWQAFGLDHAIAAKSVGSGQVSLGVQGAESMTRGTHSYPMRGGNLVRREVLVWPGAAGLNLASHMIRDIEIFGASAGVGSVEATPVPDGAVDVAIWPPLLIRAA
jgi:hypothetical protein